MRFKIRRLALIFPFILLAACLHAEDAPGGNLFMWKVTSDSGGEAYLLGSVHMMKKDIYPLPKEMEDAFARSKFLVLEADESKLDQAKMQKMVMEKGMYAGDDTLAKHLSQPTQDALKAYLDKSGVPAAMVEKTKPWMASFALSIGAMMNMGFDPEQGIDKHFLKEAKSADKEVLELESADFQLALISSFSDDLQEKFLASTLLDMESMPEDIGKMMAAWSKGDAPGLDAIFSHNLVKHPELKSVMEKLVDERNVGMAAKVEDYLKSKDIHFVVAGAAHMVGDKGVVKLLQDKNFKVEQIKKSSVSAP